LSTSFFDPRSILINSPELSEEGSVLCPKRSAVEGCAVLASIRLPFQVKQLFQNGLTRSDYQGMIAVSFQVGDRNKNWVSPAESQSNTQCVGFPAA